jgi:acetyl esterase/lipase
MKMTIITLLALASLALEQPPAPMPTPRPTIVRVTKTFATAADGTPLKWDAYYIPGSLPRPAICVWHGGGWATGHRRQMQSVCRDLAAAGFLALACDYRLSNPKNFLPGQTAKCIWPDQTSDCRLAILAARKDPLCNGQVGTMGGSAGATHAATVALTGVVGKDRSDVTVCLSANYDFSDPASLAQYRANRGNWLRDVLVYNNVPDVTHTSELRAHSVITLVPAAAPISPMFLVQSVDDAVGDQIKDMIPVLDAAGFTNYKLAIVPSSGHAKANWWVTNPATGRTVKDDSIAFFKAGFAPTPTPTQTPTPSLTYRLALHFAAIPEPEIVQVCDRFGMNLETWRRQERAFGLLSKVYVPSER